VAWSFLGAPVPNPFAVQQAGTYQLTAISAAGCTDQALVVLSVLAALFLPMAVDGVALLALHVLAGFEARDRLRARLARRGMPLQGVVLAPSLDFAWFRLAEARPDLMRSVP